MPRPSKHAPTLLDATRFQWRNLHVEENPFAAFVQQPALPKAVGDVYFDPATFEQCEYHRNGVHWSFYGSGTISEYAAVQLDTGKVLFCVVSGSQFTDTFHSADDIRMQYYELEPLTPEVTT